MLTKLTLQNWKSYKHSDLYLDPLSVLIGTNASGKSNAIDAFQFLTKIANGAALTSGLQGDSGLLPLRGGIEWAALRPETTFSLGICYKADELTDYEYEIECEINENKCEVSSEKLIRIKYRSDKSGKRKADIPPAGSIHLFRTDICTTDSPTITARTHNGSRGTPRQLSRAHPVIYQLSSQKLGQEISDGVVRVLSALKEIFVLDPIPSHMRDYKPLAEKLLFDGSNIAGVLAALPPEQRTELETTITKYATRLPEKDIGRVYAETVGRFNSDAMLYCEESWSRDGQPSTIDARGMSDGTLRFLAILTALLTRPSGSLLVIEEADNGLHPSRAQLLLDMLAAEGRPRKIDVLITTHNPAVLDAMGTEMVPFITVSHRDPTTGNSMLTLLEEIEQLPKMLAKGQVGKLTSQGKIEEALNPQLNLGIM